ncbi:MAG TPA: hypothetical protein VH497_19740 [Vicinamibacterales bacterium]
MQADENCCRISRAVATDISVVLDKRTTIGLSILTGVVLELGIHAMSGRREAWDSAEFWTLGLPVACLLSAVIGALSRSTDWKWTLVVAPSQVMTMMVRGGEVGNLWPLTLAASTILSAPFFVASYVGSRLRPAKFR